MRPMLTTGGLIAAIATVLVCLFVSPGVAGELLSEDPAVAPALAASPDATPHPKPPLPFHTIEGYGGAGITPMAYLVNPGPEECLFGKPTVGLTYINLGRKNVNAITVTETFFGRLEFGYAADRLGLGTLPGDIRDATRVDVDRSDVWLHNFNLRLLAVKEDTCFGGLALPAVTAGIHFKFNDGIETINQRLGGALSEIGYARSNSQDFTLTATKTFKEGFGRPLIATAGMRGSEAANLGFLGFSNSWHVTFEGSVAYLLTDRMVVAYEFRQKTDPYRQIPGLINGEDNWQTIDVGVVLDEHFHTTFVAGYAHLGMLANENANNGWFLQLKYEW